MSTQLVTDKWSAETIIRMLNEYQKYPCLWDTQNPLHNNRVERARAERSIFKALDMRNVDVRIFRAKVRNIRNTYRLEIYKINRGKRCGNPYQTKLTWFPVAHKFLCKTLGIVDRKVNEDIYDPGPLDEEMALLSQRAQKCLENSIPNDNGIAIKEEVNTGNGSTCCAPQSRVYQQYKSQSPEYHPQSPVDITQSPVFNPQSPVYNPQSPVNNPQSPVYIPQSPVYNPQSLVYNPPTPTYVPQSPMYNPPTPMYTAQSPVYNSQTPPYLAQTSLHSGSPSPQQVAPRTSEYTGSHPQSPSAPPVSQHTSQAKKRLRDGTLKNTSERHKANLPKMVKKTECEFEIFGKYIANHLQQLPLRKAIGLQMEVINMIGRERLNILNEHAESTAQRSSSTGNMEWGRSPSPLYYNAGVTGTPEPLPLAALQLIDNWTQTEPIVISAAGSSNSLRE